MNNPINSFYETLGRNKNTATWISCLIAVFKGTFRPIFTLRDKSQDPKTKKYAAIREGVTEIAALPLYAATPWAAGRLVDKFYHGGQKDRVMGSSKFLGVCVATTIIPFVCNLIQPPIMKALKNHDDKKHANDNPVVQQQTQIKTPEKPKTPVATFAAAKMNYGMKVGG